MSIYDNRKGNFLGIYDPIEKQQIPRDKSKTCKTSTKHYEDSNELRDIHIYESKNSKCEFGNSKLIFPNVSRDSMQSKSKSQQFLFVCENDQANSKIYIKIQTAKNSQGNPEEEQHRRTFTTK